MPIGCSSASRPPTPPAVRAECGMGRGLGVGLQPEPQPSTFTVTVLTFWALGAVTVSRPSR
jgi:hypothetical protein